MILLATLLVVQFALAYYARQVVAGAAHDGAAAAARQNSSGDAGVAVAESLVSEAAGSLLDSHSVTASANAETVTIEIEGEVVSLLPFFGTITVRASGSARVEQFDPQGGTP